MRPLLINRLGFEALNRVIGNKRFEGWEFDLRMLRKHGMRGLPLILTEAMDMARKRKTNANGNTNTERVKWCNIRIEIEHEAIISERGIDDLTLLAAILECVREGYTFGFKPSADGEGFMAYFIAPSDDHVNRGMGLAAFAGNERDAMLGLIFKHFEIADGVWPREADSESRRFR